MGQALRISSDYEDGHPEPQSRQVSRLERALYLAVPNLEKAIEREHSLPRTRDFSSAIDLVRQASHTNRALEERAHELESRLETLASRATSELKSAESRVNAAEARARTADARADVAEQRLREAEERLRQIIEVIGEELASNPQIG
jgi:chromosome segregation ATPase